MTHREFAETDEVFRLACELAKVKPTVRQASKFRSKRGSAYKFREQAIETLEVKT